MRTMTSRFEAIVALVCVAGFAGLWIGCPGGESSGETAATTAPAPAAPTADASPSPAPAGSGGAGAIAPAAATADARPASPAAAAAGAASADGSPAATKGAADAAGSNAIALTAGFEEYRVDGICVALSSDGTFLAAGDLGGRVTLWDTQRKRLLVQETLPEGNRVRRVGFARGAPVLVSGAFQAPDAPFRVWQTQPAGLRHSIGSLHWQAEQLAIDDAGQRLLGLVDVGGGTRKVVLWGVDDGEPMLSATLAGDHGFVTLSGDGQTAAASSQDGTLHVWRGTPMAAAFSQRFDGADTLQRLLLSRDGRTLWGAAGDRVFHYSLDTPPVLDRTVTLGGEDAVIRGLELLPDGRAVAVIRPATGGVQLWDVASGALLVDANGGCRCEAHALSADGRTLACDCVPDAVIRVWRLPAAP